MPFQTNYGAKKENRQACTLKIQKAFSQDLLKTKRI